MQTSMASTESKVEEESNEKFSIWRTDHKYDDASNVDKLVIAWPVADGLSRAVQCPLVLKLAIIDLRYCRFNWKNR